MGHIIYQINLPSSGNSLTIIYMTVSAHNGENSMVLQNVRLIICANVRVKIEKYPREAYVNSLSRSKPQLFLHSKQKQ